MSSQQRLALSTLPPLVLTVLGQQPGEGQVYAVPAALWGEVDAAIQNLPTLTAAVIEGETLTLHTEGHQPLTLPRAGCWVQPQGRVPGEPAPDVQVLSIYPPGWYAQGRCYRFRLDLTTPEGRAAAALLTGGDLPR